MTKTVPSTSPEQREYVENSAQPLPALALWIVEDLSIHGELLATLRMRLCPIVCSRNPRVNASRENLRPRQYDAKDMTDGKLKTVLWAVLPLAAGVALRLWYVLHAGRIEGDTLIYGSIAKNWLRYGIYGFTFGQDIPRPTLIRLPGYPLFLAVCFRLFGFDRYIAIMCLQSAIDLCTCLLISALSGRLFGHRAAKAALWLAATLSLHRDLRGSPTH